MAGKSINELPEITSVSDSSLMALSSDGKTLGRVDARTFKNSVVGQHISNYIRYINQGIKLELNNGTLTLKAGSKVYVPNGVGVFDVVNITSDITVSTPYTNESIFIYYHNNEIEQAANNAQCSGTSITVSYGYWYDTTNNFIKRIDAGEVSYSGISFPIAIINASNGSWTSIDQVFNGFGYIGSTVFALPGTVVSMPNGKEENGVLKNTEVEITSVRTVTLGSADTTDYIGYLSPTGIDYLLATNYYESVIPPTNKNGYAMWLNTQDNHFYVKNFSVSGSEWELVDALGNICKFTTSSGNITKFESKSVLSLLDTNTFKLVPHIVETWSNGTSWYRVWSDGWCEQGSRANVNQDSRITVSLLIPYVNNEYYANWISCNGTVNNGGGTRAADNLSTSTFDIWNGQDTTMIANWYACGYAA